VYFKDQINFLFYRPDILILKLHVKRKNLNFRINKQFGDTLLKIWNKILKDSQKPLLIVYFKDQFSYFTDQAFILFLFYRPRYKKKILNCLKLGRGEWQRNDNKL